MVNKTLATTKLMFCNGNIKFFGILCSEEQTTKLIAA
jgi:hypothetical protein